MERKNLILIISSILAIVIVAIIVMLISKNMTLSPAQLEECKTIKNSGKGGINVVFFSSKELAEKYSGYLVQNSPFNENKDIFNFYYIDTYTPECEMYKGVALLCYTKNLIKKSSSCPNDYIIVIKDEAPAVRSSAYMNVMSLNAKSSLNVVAHEMGHAFANLADEYIPAKIPRKSKNCVADCSEFTEKDGCYQGCSNENYYRSIDSGVMRTLSSMEYGMLNKKIISEKLSAQAKKVSAFTGSAVENPTNCIKQEYYLIEGVYSNGAMTIKSKTTETGCVGTNGAGDFQYNMVLEDNSIYQSEEFNPELIFTDIQASSETQINGGAIDSEKEFFLKISAVPNQKTLEIIKDDVKISEINLKDMGARPCKE